MTEKSDQLQLDYTQLTRGDAVHVTLEDEELECEFITISETERRQTVELRHDNDTYYITPEWGELSLWQREECFACEQMTWSQMSIIHEIDSPYVTPREQQTLYHFC